MTYDHVQVSRDGDQATITMESPAAAQRAVA